MATTHHEERPRRNSLYVGVHFPAGKKTCPHAMLMEWRHFAVAVEVSPQKSIQQALPWWLHTTRSMLLDGKTSARICVDFQMPRTPCSTCSNPSRWKWALSLNGKQPKVVVYECTSCEKSVTNSSHSRIQWYRPLISNLSFHNGVRSNCCKLFWILCRFRLNAF